MHFIHLNIRSLIPKLAEVKRILRLTGAAAAAFSETWLDETVNDAEIAVDGYSVIRRDRNRHGGGVLLYVRSGIAYDLRPELEVDGFESVWIELLMQLVKARRHAF